MTKENPIQISTSGVVQPLIDELSSQPQSSSLMTSQQMDEVLGLLRNICSHNEYDAVKKPSAYRTGGFFGKQFPTLPVACLPVRRWIGIRKHFTMLCLILIMITCTIFSGVANFSNDYAESNPSGIMASFSIGSTKDKTLYYNIKKGEEEKPLPLTASYDGRSVICILVTNTEADVSDLQIALQSLAFLRGDLDLPSPVLIFNEGNLSDEQIHAIRINTNRPIAFPKVDLSTFPNRFNPDDYVNQAQHFDVKDRKPWGYYQMIRFFLTKIWHHPSVERFETIMRMDSDSCFKAPNQYLPHMMYDHIDYHSQYVGVEPEAGRIYIEGLFDFIVEYMDRVQKSPGNVMLWHFIETTWKLGNTLPVFRTNLEISKKSFMLRKDIQKWHNTLTEGYFHKQECSREEVEMALKQHRFK